MPIRKVTVNPNATTLPVKIDLPEADLDALDSIVDAARAYGAKRPSRAKVVSLAVQRLMTTPVREIVEQLAQQQTTKPRSTRQ